MERKITRRAMITSLGGLALAAAGVEAAVLEPRRLAVTRHLLGRDVGAGDSTIAIVQISDLHLRRVGDLEERVAENVGALRPDLVVFTGDSIHDAEALPLLSDFLGLLDPATPKCSILGNWERWCGVDIGELRSIYASSNCRLLVNESAVYEYGRAEIRVTGLDDMIEGRPDIDAALRETKPSLNHLLLAHCPGQRDVIDFGALSQSSDSAPQYMLSGHTHGGQVSLWGLAPVRPRGSGRYVAGWYSGEGPDLYVSRGLGWTSLPIRLGSVPEIALFEWTLET